MNECQRTNYERFCLRFCSRNMTIIGYKILIGGQVFSDVSGRGMWISKASASRMLNYCLKLCNIDRKELEKEVPIEILPIYVNDAAYHN